MLQPLLGTGTSELGPDDAGISGLPCTVSVPNLKTDRITGLARTTAALNVRRLMYQTLIWTVRLRDHARRLRPALDSEDVQGAPDPLVDGVRRDAELDRNLLGGKVLVDEQQAVELALAEPADFRCDGRIHGRFGRNVRPRSIMAAFVIVLHQHEWLFTAKGTFKQSNGIAFESEPVSGGDRGAAKAAHFVRDSQLCQRGRCQGLPWFAMAKAPGMRH